MGLSTISTAISIGATKADGKTWASRAFHDDILEDNGGPTLHRLQAVTWTLILAGLFVWIAFFKFRLPEFDTNLLILLGISQGMYLGFKIQENRNESAGPQRAGGNGKPPADGGAGAG